MQKLSECKTERQRRDAIEAALARVGGNRTRAAQLLGVTRRHVVRILSESVRHGENGSAGETSGLTESKAGRSATVKHRAASRLRSVVAEPSLRDVELLSIELPKAQKDWLRYQAFKATLRGRSRPSMAEVLGVMIERDMVRDPIPAGIHMEPEPED